MNVLIIGGTGIISSSITRELVANGENVTVYNRGQTDMGFGDEVQQINGDRFDTADFEAKIAAAGDFDVVIDMMCFDVPQAEMDIRAFAGRTKQLIFCSTVDVYRKPAGKFPVTEAETRDSNSEYGNNKIKCEDLFMQAHNRGDFNVTVIRPAHTYYDRGNVIHTLGWHMNYLKRLRDGEPVVVHGDGSSLWVPCHADDVGHAFISACLNNAAYGESYHTTGEEWMTWDQYVATVAAAFGGPVPEIVHIPTDLLSRVAPERFAVVRENFQGNNIFDNAKAKHDLDFSYTINWAAGVRRVAKHYAENNTLDSAEDDLDHERILAAWERHSAAFADELNDLK